MACSPATADASHSTQQSGHPRDDLGSGAVARRACGGHRACFGTWLPPCAARLRAPPLRMPASSSASSCGKAGRTIAATHTWGICARTAPPSATPSQGTGRASSRCAITLETSDAVCAASWRLGAPTPGRRLFWGALRHYLGHRTPAKIGAALPRITPTTRDPKAALFEDRSQAIPPPLESGEESVPSLLVPLFELQPTASPATATNTVQSRAHIRSSDNLPHRRNNATSDPGLLATIGKTSRHQRNALGGAIPQAAQTRSREKHRTSRRTPAHKRKVAKLAGGIAAPTVYFAA